MSEGQQRTELPRSPAAASQARRAMESWLREALDQAQLEDVKLLVSELVTNAIRHPHGKGGIDLEVEVDAVNIRVCVSDPGSGFAKPKVEPPPPEALGGRGLLIVDRLAARWGVRPGNRTAVWFELDR